VCAGFLQLYGGEHHSVAAGEITALCRVRLRPGSPKVTMSQDVVASFVTYARMESAVAIQPFA
jgi:hypothetical protein